MVQVGGSHEQVEPDVGPARYVAIGSESDQLVDQVFPRQDVSLVLGLPPDRLLQTLKVARALVAGVDQQRLQDEPGVVPAELVLDHLNLVRKELLLRGLLGDAEGVACGGDGLGVVLGGGGLAELAAAHPDPLHEGVVDEDVAVVDDEVHLLVEGLEAGEHALAEGAVDAQRRGQVADAAREPEGDQLGDGQFDARAKGVAEVDHHQVARGGLDEEVLEVPVPDAEDVGDQADGRVVRDEPVLDVQEGVVVLGQLLQAEPQQPVGHPRLAPIHVLHHFFLRPRHQRLVPDVPVIAAGAEPLEVVVKLTEAIVFGGEVSFRLAFEQFEFGFVEGAQSLGLVHPLEHAEHGLHGHHFEAADFELFAIGLGVVVHDAVDQFEEVLDTLVEPHVLTALHEQHVDLLIGAEEGDAFGAADGGESEEGAVEGLDEDFVPGVRLFELRVASARDLKAGPVAAVVVLEPVAAVAQLREVLHHAGLVGVQSCHHSPHQRLHLLRLPPPVQLQQVSDLLLVVLVEALVVLAQQRIVSDELGQFLQGGLRLAVVEILGEDVLEAHFGVLDEEEALDELEIAAYLGAEGVEEGAGEVGEAVLAAGVGAVEGVDEGLGVTCEEVVEEVCEVAGEVVVAEVADDLRDEVDEHPLGDAAAGHCLLEAAPDQPPLHLHQLDQLEQHREQLLPLLVAVPPEVHQPDAVDQLVDELLGDALRRDARHLQLLLRAAHLELPLHHRQQVLQEEREPKVRGLVELHLHARSLLAAQSAPHCLVVAEDVRGLRHEDRQIHVLALVEADLQEALQVLVADGGELEARVVGEVGVCVHLLLDEFGHDLVLLEAETALAHDLHQLQLRDGLVKVPVELLRELVLEERLPHDVLGVAQHSALDHALHHLHQPLGGAARHRRARHAPTLAQHPAQHRPARQDLHPGHVVVEDLVGLALRPAVEQLAAVVLAGLRAFVEVEELDELVALLQGLQQLVLGVEGEGRDALPLPPEHLARVERVVPRLVHLLFTHHAQQSPLVVVPLRLRLQQRQQRGPLRRLQVLSGDDQHLELIPAELLPAFQFGNALCADVVPLGEQDRAVDLLPLEELVEALVGVGGEDLGDEFLGLVEVAVLLGAEGVKEAVALLPLGDAVHDGLDHVGLVEQLVVLREVEPLPVEPSPARAHRLHLAALALQQQLDDVLLGEEDRVVERVAGQGDGLERDVHELAVLLADADEALLQRGDEVEVELHAAEQQGAEGVLDQLAVLEAEGADAAHDLQEDLAGQLVVLPREEDQRLHQVLRRDLDVGQLSDLVGAQQHSLPRLLLVAFPAEPLEPRLHLVVLHETDLVLHELHRWRGLAHVVLLEGVHHLVAPPLVPEEVVDLVVLLGLALLRSLALGLHRLAALLRAQRLQHREDLLLLRERVVLSGADQPSEVAALRRGRRALLPAASEGGEGGVGEGGVADAEVAEVPVVVEHVLLQFGLREEPVVVGGHSAEREDDGHHADQPLSLATRMIQLVEDGQVAVDVLRLGHRSGFLLELSEHHLAGGFEAAAEALHQFLLHLVQQRRAEVISFGLWIYKVFLEFDEEQVVLGGDGF